MRNTLVLQAFRDQVSRAARGLRHDHKTRRPPAIAAESYPGSEAAIGAGASVGEHPLDRLSRGRPFVC
jgi:hypothetical protein